MSETENCFPSILLIFFLQKEPPPFILNVRSLMPASHCPEVHIRWIHEYGNVQIRAWSQSHRAIREGILCHLIPSYDHRLSFSGSAGTSWALPKSLACQRIARRPREGSCSCWIRVSILPFVRPSWGYLIQSCHLRVNFVWSSVASGMFAYRRQYEGNTKLTDGLRKATRLREAIAITSCSHRIIVRWHWDGTTMLAKTAELGSSRVSHVCVMVIWPHKRPASEHLPQSALNNSAEQYDVV